MSTSDADKPPICTPAPVVARQSNPPSSEASARHDVVDAVAAPVQPAPVPGTLLHWTFLAIAVAVAIASLTLSIRNREQVIVPIINAPLPGTCTFRKLTGVPCPGCGLTRSFISMGHGRIHAAWSYNPAGFFFFAVVAFQIPYRMYQIARIRRGHGQHRFAWIDNWTLIVLVMVLVVQWIHALVARAV